MKDFSNDLPVLSEFITIGQKTIPTTSINWFLFDFYSFQIDEEIKIFERKKKQGQVTCGTKVVCVESISAEIIELAIKSKKNSLKNANSAWSMAWAKFLTLEESSNDETKINLYLNALQAFAELCQEVNKHDFEDKNSGQEVYFVLNKTRQLMKIGYSVCVPARFSNFVSATVDDLVLIGTLEGGASLEKEMHKKFADLRVRKDREWFRYEKDLKVFVKKTFKIN